MKAITIDKDGMIKRITSDEVGFFERIDQDSDKPFTLEKRNLMTAWNLGHINYQELVELWKKLS